MDKLNLHNAIKIKLIEMSYRQCENIDLGEKVRYDELEQYREDDMFRKLVDEATSFIFRLIELEKENDIT